MNELKIVADSRLEAVLRVKSKLGPDAIIISEKKTPAPGLPGLLGKKVYEVVARPAGMAPSGQEHEREQEQYPDVDQVRRELEELRETVNALFEKGVVMMSPAAPPQAHQAWQMLGPNPAELGQYGDRMPTRELIESLLPSCPEEPVAPDRTRVIALIGPAGVGKTLTACKLALRYSNRACPAILGMDYKKPGGMDQTRAIAAALGIPFEAANTSDEAPGALQKLLPREIVLVDTAAVQPGHGLVFEETRSALHEMGAEPVLVLSAGSKPKDALRFVDMTAGVGVSRIIYTHLDDTLDWSAMLTVGARWGLPIQYVSDGPGIEDIVPAESAKLVESILAGAKA